MKRKLAVAAVSAFVTLLMLPGVAAAVWGGTPRSIAAQLGTHYRTSDGHSLVYVVCVGVASSAHRKHGTLYYHRLGCGETDDVGRVWGVNVVVHGLSALSVTEVSCDASHATIPCP
jgi:hypothetical protein